MVNYEKKIIQSIKPELLEQTIVTILLGLITPIWLHIIQKLVDQVVTAFQSEKVIVYFALLLLVFGTNILLKKRNQEINIRWDRKSVCVIEPLILEKKNKIKYECYENDKLHDVFELMGSNISVAMKKGYDTFMSIASLVITLCGIAVMYIQVSPILVITYVVLILVQLTMDYFSMTHMNNMMEGQSKSERFMNYYYELLSDKDSILDLKVNNAISYMMKKWKVVSDKVIHERMKTTFLSQRFLAVNIIATILWVIYTVLVLRDNLRVGTITIGLFVAIFSSMNTVLEVSEQLSFHISNMGEVLLAGKYMKKFFRMQEEENGSENIESENGLEIEFRNVKFQYPGQEKMVLDDISFKIEKGEKIALVGENGSGKTTIVKLLCGLYTPLSGEILINGKNLRDINRKSFVECVGLVFQQYLKYPYSIKENIAIGRNVSENELKECIEVCNFDDGMDFDTNLGRLEAESIDLSGGQWQKIAMARGICKKKELVILDEPTAALDPISESRLYASFQTALGNGSGLLISHRLASTKLCQRIFLLKDGKIIENGSFEELLELNGQYAEMYRKQEAWYKEKKDV